MLAVAPQARKEIRKLRDDNRGAYAQLRAKDAAIIELQAELQSTQDIADGRFDDRNKILDLKRQLRTLRKDGNSDSDEDEDEGRNGSKYDDRTKFERYVISLEGEIQALKAELDLAREHAQEETTRGNELYSKAEALQGEVDELKGASLEKEKRIVQVNEKLEHAQEEKKALHGALKSAQVECIAASTQRERVRSALDSALAAAILDAEHSSKALPEGEQLIASLGGLAASKLIREEMNDLRNDVARKEAELDDRDQRDPKEQGQIKASSSAALGTAKSDAAIGVSYVHEGENEVVYARRDEMSKSGETEFAPVRVRLQLLTAERDAALSKSMLVRTELQGAKRELETVMEKARLDASASADKLASLQLVLDANEQEISRLKEELVVMQKSSEAEVTHVRKECKLQAEEQNIALVQEMDALKQKQQQLEVLATTLEASNKELSAEIDALRSERVAHIARLEEHTRTVEELASEKSSLESRLAIVEESAKEHEAGAVAIASEKSLLVSQIQSLKEKLNGGEKQVKSLQSELDALRKSNEALRVDVEEQAADLKNQKKLNDELSEETQQLRQEMNDVSTEYAAMIASLMASNSILKAIAIENNDRLDIVVAESRSHDDALEVTSIKGNDSNVSFVKDLPGDIAAVAPIIDEVDVGPTMDKEAFKGSEVREQQERDNQEEGGVGGDREEGDREEVIADGEGQERKEDTFKEEKHEMEQERNVEEEDDDVAPHYDVLMQSPTPNAIEASNLQSGTTFGSRLGVSDGSPDSSALKNMGKEELLHELLASRVEVAMLKQQIDELRDAANTWNSPDAVSRSHAIRSMDDRHSPSGEVLNVADERLGSCEYGEMEFSTRDAAVAPALTSARLDDVLNKLLASKSEKIRDRGDHGNIDDDVEENGNSDDGEQLYQEAIAMLQAELHRLGMEIAEKSNIASHLRQEVGALHTAELKAETAAQLLEENNALVMKVAALSIQLQERERGYARCEESLCREIARLKGNNRSNSSQKLKSRMSRVFSSAAKGMQRSFDSALQSGKGRTSPLTAFRKRDRGDRMMSTTERNSVSPLGQGLEKLTTEESGSLPFERSDRR